MSADARGGTLGAVAVAELRQIAVAREQLARQQAALAQQEARVLALVAEAQGCPVEPARTRFDYDLDAAEPRWWVLAEPVASVALAPPVDAPEDAAAPDGG